MNKKMIYGGLFVAVAVLSSSGLRAQDESNDSTINSYRKLVKSSDPGDHEKLEVELYKKLKSKEERDWITAMNFFYQLDKTTTVDSIKKIILVKYPKGEQALYERSNKISELKDPMKMEAAFNKLLIDIPPHGTDQMDLIQYDYTRANIAHGYFDKKNITKAIQFINQIETRAWKGEAYAGMAERLLNIGRLKEAEDFARKAQKNALEYRTTRRGEPGWEFAAAGFGFSCDLLSRVFYKKGEIKDALVYAKQANDSTEGPQMYALKNYIKLLAETGNNKEALDRLTVYMVAGNNNRVVDSTYRSIYAKVNGNTTGVEAALSKIKEESHAKLLKELPSKMVNVPSPQFTLKDTKGNAVSLSDFKGKTVVLDFWATWCGPCKASFPAMQSTVIRYNNDTNVVFLFIHTWERGTAEVARTEADKYLKDNKYDFHVLMDVKSGNKKQKQIVESFGVEGIPAKFIIDPSGNIRFSVTGLNGGNDAAVAELSAMIELARKS